MSKEYLETVEQLKKRQPQEWIQFSEFEKTLAQQDSPGSIWEGSLGERYHGNLESFKKQFSLIIQEIHAGLAKA